MKWFNATNTTAPLGMPLVAVPDPSQFQRKRCVFEFPMAGDRITKLDLTLEARLIGCLGTVFTNLHSDNGATGNGPSFDSDKWTALKEQGWREVDAYHAAKAKPKPEPSHAPKAKPKPEEPPRDLEKEKELDQAALARFCPKIDPGDWVRHKVDTGGNLFLGKKGVVLEVLEGGTKARVQWVGFSRQEEVPTVLLRRLTEWSPREIHPVVWAGLAFGAGLGAVLGVLW